MPHPFPLVLAIVLPLALLRAQKVPVRGDAARVLQVVDLTALQPPADEQEPNQLKTLTGLDAFARRFVEPALGPDDDIRMLGRGRLAALGTPQQVAWVENLVAMGAQYRGDEIFVDVKLLKVPSSTFDSTVKSVFAAQQHPGRAPDAPLQATVTWPELTGLLQNLKGQPGFEVLQAPKIVAVPLQPCILRIGKEIPYVRDYTVNAKGDTVVATPVNDTLFDGHDVEVVAAFLGKGRIAVQCSVTQREVQQPLPEIRVAIGTGEPMTLQVPHVQTVAFEDIAVLQDGSAALLACRRPDGSVLVAAIVLNHIRAADKQPMLAPLRR
jgi:hypothetical protein